MTDPSLTPRSIRSLNDGDLQTPMQYDAFLLELGVLLRLPPRAAPAPSTGRTPLFTGSARLAIPLLALAALGVFAVSRWQPRDLARVPVALIGTWETDDSRYARRAFSVNASHLLLVTDRAVAPLIHPIRAVTTIAQRGDTTEFLIEYAGDEGDSELHLRHIGGRQATIILKNPGDARWRRAPEPGAGVRTRAQGDAPA